MPWLTSILVLQPRTSTEMDGPVGGLVCVLTGVPEGSKVGAVVAVINGIAVEVAICGVGVPVGAPLPTGVAVKMDGVFVGGRKGVGGLNGPG